MSKPDGAGVMRASIALVAHFGQSGRERGNMMLRLVSGGSVALALSHRWIPSLSGDGCIMRPFEVPPLFCFAHFWKVNCTFKAVV
jgi:hypothetical protein